MGTGSIVSFNPKKGEGFLQPDGQDEHLPFEVNPDDDRWRLRPLQKGDRVTYDVEGGLAGVMAIDLRRVE